MQRTLTGVQSKRDSIAAQGTENHTAKVNSMRETLESVQRRTGKLERNADHLLSQYEDLDKQTSSKFEQTAEMIQSEVTSRQNADNEMSSLITQVSDNISLEVANRQNADSVISASLELKVGKYDNDQIVSMINASADQIYLRSNRLVVESDNFELGADGKVHIVDELQFDSQGNTVTIIDRDGMARACLQNIRLDLSSITDMNGFAIASDQDIPDTSSFVLKWSPSISNPTLSAPTLSGNIDAIGIKGRSSSAAANVRCQDGISTGYLAIAATSSKRYKHGIADISKEELNPARLYNLPVRQFIYNLDYIEPDDQRYGETVCGFIAEEVEKVYPVACEYNADGLPENWDIRYIVPPMLSLIQDQHAEIERLKQDNISLKGEVDILKQRLEKMEEMLDVINSKIN